MIDGLQAHPSIVMWVVFNEGWGQFDTKRVADWTKAVRPDPAGQRRQRLGRPRGRGRRPRPPRLPPPRRPAAGGEAGGRPRRVRRPLARASTATPGRRRSGATHGTASGGRADPQVRAAAPRGLGHEGRQGPQRPGLHPDHRRRDRGQRPADLRPGGHQGRPRPGRRREPGRRLAGPRGPDGRADLAGLGPALAVLDREALRPTGTPPTSTTPRGRKAPASSGPRGPPAPTSGRPGTPPTSGPAGPSTSPRSTRPTSCSPSSTTRTPRSTSTACSPPPSRATPAATRSCPSPPRPAPPSSPARTSIAVHCHQTGGGQSIDAGLIELKEPAR